MKVLKIGAVWCSGCLVMKPRWAEIEKENPWLETKYYEFDDSPLIVEKYKIGENLPVFIFLDKEENELFRLEGEISKEELVRLIKENKDK
ncbi:MAG: thioredoxin family protein [Candidatus Pacebacteria bacterium]|nr:thioredoxin family protein [Candidatus Paceibacterota bacterium]